MIGFLFSPFGKIAIGIALALSLYFGLKVNNAYQRADGANKMRVEYETALKNAKDLTDVQTKSASDAASSAARRVCIEEGVDPSYCSDL